MTVALADVFAVPVGRHWLITAPLKGISACVNRTAVVGLASLNAQALSGALRDFSQALDAAPVTLPVRKEGPVSPQFLGLITTRACNMGCRYCGFGAGTAPMRQLEPSLAVAAIDWMADIAAREQRPTLDVHLFGGEPFYADDVVDVIVHHTRIAAAERGLRPVLEAATNGICSPERAAFIGDYFSSIVLSFDGPADVHDRHRPLRSGAPSFAAVKRTADILAQSQTSLHLRVCVSQHNVARLAAITSWAADTFSPSGIDIETLQVNDDARRAGLAAPDPYEFAAAFRAAQRAAQGTGVEVTTSSAVQERPRVSFCPAGHDAVIVDADGTLTACYLPGAELRAKNANYRLGRLLPESGLAFEPGAVERVRAATGPKERCAACFCRYWCAGGCHVNHAGGTHYDDFCVQTRLITAAQLLDQLNMPTVASEVLADRVLSERLALRASDHIGDGMDGDE